MIKKLYWENWNFTLYQVDDKLVLSVVFFGMVDYHRSFYINQDQYEGAYENLKNISENIRNNYENFKDMEIVPAITNENAN